jgi:glycosyltransferase involved in cell wall biosynthesis
MPGAIHVEAVDDSLPRHLPVAEAGLYAAYLRYCFWQKRAATWMKAHSALFDVVHHVSWASISLPIGAAYSGLPFVVGPIGGGQLLDERLFRWIDGSTKFEQLRNRIVRSVTARNPLARRASRDSGALLASNEETRQLLMTKLGATAVSLMIPDGIKRVSADESTIAYPKEKEIVWVGRFKPFKGAGLAVKAFRLALNEHPDAHMTMVGDGPAREAVMDSCQDLVASGHVDFPGQVPWADGQSLLRRARIHLFSSLRESFGAQVLEAAAHGVPTVALNNYGLRTFCQRAGFNLVDPFPSADLDARLAEAIAESLSWSESHWLQQSDGARSLALENTYARKAAAMEKIYTAMAL